MTRPAGGVDSFAVDQHLEMQVRCRRPPGRANAADRGAGRNGVALLDQQRGEVGVAGLDPLAVADHHEVAVSAALAGGYDRAAARRRDLGTVAGAEVDAAVEPGFAGEGVRPPAVGRGDRGRERQVDRRRNVDRVGGPTPRRTRSARFQRQDRCRRVQIERAAGPPRRPGPAPPRRSARRASWSSGRRGRHRRNAPEIRRIRCRTSPASWSRRSLRAPRIRPAATGASAAPSAASASLRTAATAPRPWPARRRVSAPRTARAPCSARTPGSSWGWSGCRSP